MRPSPGLCCHIWEQHPDPLLKLVGLGREPQIYPQLNMVPIPLGLTEPDWISQDLIGVIGPDRAYLGQTGPEYQHWTPEMKLEVKNSIMTIDDIKVCLDTSDTQHLSHLSQLITDLFSQSHGCPGSVRAAAGRFGALSLIVLWCHAI